MSKYYQYGARYFVAGEVLAAVSDEKTGEKIGDGSSPAFEQMLEPASILKLITVTAAFRNKLDPEGEIAGMTCRGANLFFPPWKIKLLI